MWVNGWNEKNITANGATEKFVKCIDCSFTINHCHVKILAVGIICSATPFFIGLACIDVDLQSTTLHCPCLSFFFSVPSLHSALQPPLNVFIFQVR